MEIEGTCLRCKDGMVVRNTTYGRVYDTCPTCLGTTKVMVEIDYETIKDIVMEDIADDRRAYQEIY